MFQFGMLLQLVELVENLSTAISNPLLVRGFEDLSKSDAVVEGHVCRELLKGIGNPSIRVHSDAALGQNNGDRPRSAS